MIGRDKIKRIKVAVKLIVGLLIVLFIITNLEGVRSFSIGLWEGTLAFFDFMWYLIYYETEVFVQLVITMVICYIAFYWSGYRVWQKPIYVHSEEWKIDKYIGRVAWIKGSGKGIIYGVWHLSRRILWALVNLVIFLRHVFRLMIYKAQRIGGTDPKRPELRIYKFEPKDPMKIPIGDTHHTGGPVIYFRRLGCFWRDIWPWKTPKIYHEGDFLEEGTWKIVLSGYNLIYSSDKDITKSHFDLVHETMGKHDHGIEPYSEDLKKIELDSQSMVEKAIGSDSETAKREREKFTVLHPREILKREDHG